MAKITLIVSSIFGVLGVSLGAFGAHALKPFLMETNTLSTFETAVRYQFYHALFLLFLGTVMIQINSKWLKYAAISTITGIVLFSGSLYLLCFTQQSFWGPITPIGGVMLIIGWCFLGIGIFKTKLS